MQEIQFTFDAAGGRVDLTRITAVYGDRVGALPRPERRGYVFDGWYLASAGASILTLRVIWRAITSMCLSLIATDWIR